MASTPVLKPHIDPDPDGTFNSHYYDHATVDAALAAKADQANLDATNAELATKLSAADIAGKADKSYVDSQDALKADLAAVTQLTPGLYETVTGNGVATAKVKTAANFQALGGKTDGTDMAATLTAALAQTAAAGIPLYLPPGDYTIASRVTVPEGAQVFGQGPFSRIVTTLASDHLFYASGKNNLRFEGFAIRGDAAKAQTDAGMAAIYVQNGVNIAVRGMDISFWCGHAAVKLYQVEDIWLQNNYCHDNYQGQNGNDLMVYGGQKNVVITGNIGTSNVTNNISVNEVGNQTTPRGGTPGQIIVANNVCDCLIRGTPITSGYIDALVGPAGQQEPMKHRRGIEIGYNGGSGQAVIVANSCRNGAWNGIYAIQNTTVDSGPYLVANNLISNFGFGDPGVPETGLYGGIVVITASSANKNAQSEIVHNIIMGGSTYAYAVKISSIAPILVESNLISACTLGINDDGLAASSQIRNNNLTLTSSASAFARGIYLIATAGKAPSTGDIDIMGNVVRINTAGLTGVGGILIDPGGFARALRCIDNIVDLVDNSGATVASAHGIHIRNNNPANVGRNRVKGFKEGIYFESVWTSANNARGKVRVHDNRLEQLTTGIVLRNSVSAFNGLVPVWNNSFDTVTNRTGADGFFATALEVESYDEATGCVTFRNTGVPAAAAGFQAGDRCVNTTLTTGQPMGWTYDGAAWKSWGNWA